MGICITLIGTERDFIIIKKVQEHVVKRNRARRAKRKKMEKETEKILIMRKATKATCACRKEYETNGKKIKWRRV